MVPGQAGCSPSSGTPGCRSPAFVITCGLVAWICWAILAQLRKDRILPLRLHPPAGAGGLSCVPAGTSREDCGEHSRRHGCRMCHRPWRGRHRRCPGRSPELGGGQCDPGRGRTVPAGPPPHPADGRRRFNRRRYNAAQSIEAFSTRLHQQIDLDTLSAELLSVVDQTMQPTKASLWLGPSLSSSPSRDRAN